MKPLSTFKKKMARWYSIHPIIHGMLIFFGPFVSIAISFGAMVGVIIWLKPPREIERLFAAFFAFTSIFFMMVCAYRDFVRLVNIEMLPERAIEDSRKTIEKNPSLLNHLEQLIEIALKEDDGTNLREYLEKIKKWEELKKSLADFQQAEKNIIEKITALEKELRMEEKNG
jgi:hypothetical protein